jgi:hypothetical protein
VLAHKKIRTPSNVATAEAASDVRVEYFLKSSLGSSSKQQFKLTVTLGIEEFSRRSGQCAEGTCPAVQKQLPPSLSMLG